MAARTIIGTFGVVAVVGAVAMPADARTTSGAANPPPGPPCSLVSRHDAAHVLHVRASTLKRRFDYSSVNNFCLYTNGIKKGPMQRSVQVSWLDDRNNVPIYEAYRDHRYRGCAKGPTISGADKTCWDHGRLILFAKAQITTVWACHSVSCAVHTAGVKARMSALLVKVFSRLPDLSSSP